MTVLERQQQTQITIHEVSTKAITALVALLQCHNSRTGSWRPEFCERDVGETGGKALTGTGTRMLGGGGGGKVLESSSHG